MPEETSHDVFNLTQQELLDRFNLAFYEAQNATRPDLIASFDESYLDVLEPPLANPDENLDYNLDFFTSDESFCTSTPVASNTSTFDFTFQDQSTFKRSTSSVYTGFDTETFSTEYSADRELETDVSFDLEASSLSSFFVPPPMGDELPEDLDWEDIALDDTLSESSFDFDSFTKEFGDLEDHERVVLPPVTTISRNNMDFNRYLRTVPSDDLDFSSEVRDFSTAIWTL